MWRALRGSNANTLPPPTTQSQQQERQDLEEATEGLLHVLNDDFPTAEAILQRRDSAFHLLGRGTTLFIKGLLSYEPDVLREASRALSEGARVASEEQKRSLKQPFSSSSRSYPTGSEFAVCFEAAQILRAILSVLDANITETLRGFYNVRRAYATFGSLVASQIARPVDDHASSLLKEPTTTVAEISASTSQLSLRSSINTDEDEFFDAEEYPTQGTSVSQASDIHRTDADLRSSCPNTKDDSSHINNLDRFVHTGCHVGFGALLLGISLVPSVFATLLKIVGFTGDRARGLGLLWRGAEATDGFGSVGALILMEYYKAIGSMCEILAEDLYPRSRIQRLVGTMRSRFPDGRLWMIYEAHFAAQERNLERAIELVGKEHGSPLSQMKALQLYEHSVYSMHMHKYEDCRQGFEDYIPLNERANALSYFAAGSASLALYRQNKQSDEAAKHANDSCRLFALAAQSAGQKRFLTKRIPFDVYIIQKVDKWRARAKARKIDLIDAIGASPIDEMIYFYDGFKRLSPEHLEQSLVNLQWLEKHPALFVPDDDADEYDIQIFLRATVLRNLGRRAEAKELLQEVMSSTRSSTNGPYHKHNWMRPLAHFEMAISLWEECDGTAEDTARLQECLALVDQVSNWEEFDMQGAYSIQLSMAREGILKRQSEIVSRSTLHC